MTSKSWTLPFLTSALLSTSLFFDPSSAVRIPFERRTLQLPPSLKAIHSRNQRISTLDQTADLLERRGVNLNDPSSTSSKFSNSSSSSDASGSQGGVTNAVNVGDSYYLGNVTLGGKDYKALLDMGSADLWISDNVPGAEVSKTPITITYAAGSASGNVSLVDTEFDGYKVTKQAFLMVTDTQDMSLDGYSGIAGLGPSQDSLIKTKVTAPSTNPVKYDTLLDRIFQLNMTSSNILTLALGRDSSTGTETISSELTIMELISGFEAISDQPKLPVAQVPNSDRINQHWALHVDGIIGPDGKQINVTTSTKNSDGRLIGFLDSGFTLPQVPKSVSDAIYSNVPGAQFSTSTNVGDVWTLPCEVELNVTLVIGGQNYPVHPLDTSLDVFGQMINGQKVCVGSFQPITFGTNNDFDMVLGEAFMRNVYTLVNFGDFVTETNAQNSTRDPYIQLMTTVNTGLAHQDFVTKRLGGVDTTSSQPPSTKTIAGSGSASPPPLKQSDSSTKSWWNKLSKGAKIGIIAGAGVLAALIIVSLLRSCFRRPSRSRPIPVQAPGLMSYNRSTPVYSGGQSYAPLKDQDDLEFGGRPSYR